MKKHTPKVEDPLIHSSNAILPLLFCTYLSKPKPLSLSLFESIFHTVFLKSLLSLWGQSEVVTLIIKDGGWERRSGDSEGSNGHQGV